MDWRAEKEMVWISMKNGEGGWETLDGTQIGISEFFLLHN